MVGITPTFERTDPPEIITVHMLNHAINVMYDDIDFSQGGISSNKDIDSLQRYLEMGRLQQALSYKLASQAGNLNPDQAIMPVNSFPSYTLPGGSWHTFVLGRIWGSLRSMGEKASVCLA